MWSAADSYFVRREQVISDERCHVAQPLVISRQPSQSSSARPSAIEVIVKSATQPGSRDQAQATLARISHSRPERGRNALPEQRKRGFSR